MGLRRTHYNEDSYPIAGNMDWLRKFADNQYMDNAGGEVEKDIDDEQNTQDVNALDKRVNKLNNNLDRDTETIEKIEKKSKEVIPKLIQKINNEYSKQLANFPKINKLIRVVSEKVKNEKISKSNTLMKKESAVEPEGFLDTVQKFLEMTRTAFPEDQEIKELLNEAKVSIDSVGPNDFVNQGQGPYGEESVLPKEDQNIDSGEENGEANQDLPQFESIPGLINSIQSKELLLLRDMINDFKQYYGKEYKDVYKTFQYAYKRLNYLLGYFMRSSKKSFGENNEDLTKEAQIFNRFKDWLKTRNVNQEEKNRQKVEQENKRSQDVENSISKMTAQIKGIYDKISKIPNNQMNNYQKKAVEDIGKITNYFVLNTPQQQSSEQIGNQPTAEQQAAEQQSSEQTGNQPAAEQPAELNLKTSVNTISEMSNKLHTDVLSGLGDFGEQKLNENGNLTINQHISQIANSLNNLVKRIYQLQTSNQGSVADKGLKIKNKESSSSEWIKL